MNPYSKFNPYQPLTRDSDNIPKRVPMNMMLTRAYVPDQPYIGMFPLEEGLRRGTIFPNLAVPYAMKKKE